MKQLIFLILLLPFVGHAETVALSFKAVRVVDFAEATYKAMLNKDYLISPEVLGMDKRVTINVKSIDRDKLQQLLSDVLASVSVTAKESGGIVRLEKSALSDPLVAAIDNAKLLNSPLPGLARLDMAGKEIEEQDYEIYRPKNRTVEYLQMVLRSTGLLMSAPGAQPGNQIFQDAMIISGTDARREKILKLLGQLDQKPVVMNVRAALVEFTDSKDDSFSFGAILDILGGKLSLALNSALLPSDNYARLKTSSIDAVFKAINGDSRFHFRTQPTLRLVDGEKGRLMVGSEVPVRGALTLSKDGIPIQSIDYRSSGLVLTIQPRALDGRFTASIMQEVSSFANTSTSNIDSPTLNKRSIEAVVDAEDGEVVVLAGLDEESSSNGRSGLLWFPTSKTETERKTRLFVLLEFQRI
ncbi:MAG: hypothetical protein LBE81_05015 [Azonexus sp.]|jgi:type II secretory pathway component GspD/PulD (secretin)|uniref:type II secretion system protein GspD n=1 Tax=Azonexus sp. TaxID=1872668 RepID=UPI0028259E04|nr:hypothetical protein [Azonexus sp.]MDR0775981.1 hypothetical protein [Azonexus sp.]